MSVSPHGLSLVIATSPCPRSECGPDRAEPNGATPLAHLLSCSGIPGLLFSWGGALCAQKEL